METSSNSARTSRLQPRPRSRLCCTDDSGVTLGDALEDLHASPSRHAWLTAHLRRHTWDRGGNGRRLLRWAHAQQIPYLTMANGWVYLSSQRAPLAQTLDRLPVFIRPSHRGHWSTSHPHARCSSVAHAMRDDTFSLGHAVGAPSHPASHAAAPSLPETRVVSAAGVVVARSSPPRRF